MSQERPGRDDPGYGHDYDYGPPASYGVGPPPPKDDLAITAMVAGIASLVLGCAGLGLLGSPVALGLGLASMRRIDRSQGHLGGRGQAKAGFIMGVIGSVLLVVLVLAVVGVFALGGGSGATTGSGHA